MEAEFRFPNQNVGDSGCSSFEQEEEICLDAIGKSCLECRKSTSFKLQVREGFK